MRRYISAPVCGSIVGDLDWLGRTRNDLLVIFTSDPTYVLFGV